MQTEVTSTVEKKLNLLWNNAEMRSVAQGAWTAVWGEVAMPIYQACIGNIEEVVFNNLLSSVQSELSYQSWLTSHFRLAQAEDSEIDWKVHNKAEEMQNTVASAMPSDLVIQAIIDSVKSEVNSAKQSH